LLLFLNSISLFDPHYPAANTVMLTMKAPQAYSFAGCGPSINALPYFDDLLIRVFGGRREAHQSLGTHP
jgi:hypothetical protein